MSAVENLAFLAMKLKNHETEYAKLLEVMKEFEEFAKEQRAIVREIDESRCNGERFGAADSAARDIAESKALAAEAHLAIATAACDSLGVEMDHLIAECQRAQGAAALEMEWRNRSTKDRLAAYYGEVPKKKGFFSSLRLPRVDIF